MSLNKDFAEMLSALNDSKAKYLVIGVYALADADWLRKAIEKQAS